MGGRLIIRLATSGRAGGSQSAVRYTLYHLAVIVPGLAVSVADGIWIGATGRVLRVARPVKLSTKKSAAADRVLAGDEQAAVPFGIYRALRVGVGAWG